MSKLRVSSFAVSSDGFGAGLDQDLEHPIGVGGMVLMDWFFPTHTWKSMHGEGGGETGIDDGLASSAMQGFGAWILGRNMFGPIRGPWPDERWKGWWGEEPPYHVPTFVLTHHARPSIRMKGGTEFIFVTGGIQDALARARAAAGSMDIRVGGGVSTVRQYLEAGLLDELHLAVRPILMGRGEALWTGLDLPSLGYEAVKQVAGERATHLFLRKRTSPGAT